jgi:hypothetical protein
VIEVTEQDDVAVLRLADGKVNAMSMELCETLTSPNSKLTPNQTSRKASTRGSCKLDVSGAAGTR